MTVSINILLFERIFMFSEQQSFCTENDLYAARHMKRDAIAPLFMSNLKHGFSAILQNGHRSPEDRPEDIFSLP